MELCEAKVKSILYIPRDVFRFVSGGLELMRKKRKDFPVIGLILILGNDNTDAGRVDRHYFLQDIYMAKKSGRAIRNGIMT